MHPDFVESVKFEIFDEDQTGEWIEQDPTRFRDVQHMIEFGKRSRFPFRIEYMVWRDDE